MSAMRTCFRYVASATDWQHLPATGGDMVASFRRRIIGVRTSGMLMVVKSIPRSANSVSEAARNVSRHRRGL